MNLSLRLTAGYINPRDFLQDTVGAKQLLAGKTLYPSDLQQLATAETAAPFLGEAALRKIPLLDGEFRNLRQNVTQNAHPPLVALLAASPVALLGTEEASSRPGSCRASCCSVYILVSSMNWRYRQPTYPLTTLAAGYLLWEAIRRRRGSRTAAATGH